MYDIVAISESWMNGANTDNHLITIPGYLIFRADRNQRAQAGRGGGVLLYVRDTLNATEITITHDSDSDTVWCSLTASNQVKYVIGCIYRPPNSSTQDDERLFNHIREVNLAHTRSNIIILGDFNFPNVDWKKGHFPTGTKGLQSLIEDCLFLQQVSQPTRYTNILDLVLTRHVQPANLKINYLPPLGRSDHNCVDVHVTFADATRFHTEQSSKIIRYHYERADWKAMCEDLHVRDWSSFWASSNVDDCWRILRTQLRATIDNHVPKSYLSHSIRAPKPPWLGSLNRSVLLAKKEAWLKYRKSKCLADLNHYKDTRNTAANHIKYLRASYEKQLANKAKTDPKSFFQYARSKNANQSKNMTLTDGDNPISDKRTVAELFNNHFVTVFSVDSVNPRTRTSTEVRSCPETQIVADKIHPASVEMRLKKLNINKSAGPDNIPNVILRETRSVLTPLLVHLFKTSIRTGLIPTEWKHAVVVPIHKSGDVKDRRNYRPISLTCTVCKVLESIVFEQLWRYTSERCPMRNTQYGFRSNRSSTAQLIDYVNDLTEALDKGLCIDAAYLDFSKAFDKVSHKLLLDKLVKRSVPSTLVEWVRSFLLERTQSVRIGTEISTPRAVTSGVPQGSILGPLLFLLFVDDIDSVIDPSTVISKFADDLKLYFIYNPATIEHSIINSLQLSLDNILQWSEENKLPLNLNKCTIVQFGRKNPRLLYNLSTHPMQTKTCERDLGVFIDDKLSFDPHVSAVVSKAKRLSGLMFHTFASRSRHVIVPVFKTLIRPILEYGSPAWNTSTVHCVNMLESVQHYVTKQVFGLYNMSYDDRLVTLNLCTLSIRREYLDLVEMFKIIHYCTFVKSRANLQFMQTITRGHVYRLRKPTCHLNVRHDSFFLRTVNAWNALPPEIVNSNSLDLFKQRLRMHLRIT